MSKDDGERGKPAPAPGFDPPEPDETRDNLEEGHGWASIAEWTGGLQPEAIPELGDMRGLEYVYPLLRALVGRSIREFFVRAGALKAIVASDKAFLGREELDRVLFWLDERSRDATVRALRSCGWLEYEAASGTFVTEAGRWAYEVLSFLHKRLGEGEFRPTVAGIGYSLAIGADPLWLLSSLRSRLLLLRATSRSLHPEPPASRRCDGEILVGGSSGGQAGWTTWAKVAAWDALRRSVDGSREPMMPGRPREGDP